MDVFLTSFNAVSPILLLGGLGWLIKRLGHIDEHSISVLNSISFNYLVSILIFNSTLTTDFYSDFDPRLIIACALGIVFLMIASWVIFGLFMKDRARRCIFIMGTFRTNYVLFAIPITITMFGHENLTAAVLLIPVAIILFNFFGIIVLAYHSQNSTSIAQSVLRTVIDFCKNPQILGAVFGIALSLARIQLPQFLMGGIGFIASAAPVISLLLLGAQLDFKKLAGDLKPVLAMCTVRLVIAPAIILPFLIGAGFRGPELCALLMVFATPMAVNCLVMARNYNIDPPFAAQSVMVSMVLSIPTMFIFISLLTGLGLFYS